MAEPGALTDLLDMTNAGIWADPKDAANIGNKFLMALKLPTRDPDEIQRQFGEQFHYRNLSGRLANVIHDLARQHR